MCGQKGHKKSVLTSILQAKDGFLKESKSVGVGIMITSTIFLPDKLKEVPRACLSSLPFYPEIH